MHNLDDFGSAPIGTFLDAVARAEPAPGGGSVAALSVAMAAALVAMAAAFARDTPFDAAAIRAEADVLRDRAVHLAGADAEAYLALVSARRRPGNDPARAGEIASALVEASGTPLQVAEAARRVNELALELVGSGNQNLRGDAVTAAHLAAAAARSAAVLVLLNLADPDDPMVRRAADIASGCVVPT